MGKKLEVLLSTADGIHVGWFGRDTTRPGGSLGFVDPGRILRAVHLIPAFAHLDS
jgi:hypothetical protein